ncbi:MAG: hypothetical protein ACR2K3_09230 [Nocardioides sp.]
MTPDPLVDRFATPLDTQTEAARYLGVPSSTFRAWSRGYRVHRPNGDVTGEPVITSLDAPRGEASVPFVGLAEGYALTAIRRAGVPLQRIRPAIAELGSQLGVTHALASKRLFTDGVEVLFDYAEHVCGDEARAVRELVVIRNGQRVFNEAVDAHPRRVGFAPDGYATTLPLVGFRRAQVLADANRSFGQPIFARGGARLSDALGLFRAGEDISVVAEEYGVPRDEIEDAIRQSLPTTA